MDSFISISEAAKILGISTWAFKNRVPTLIANCGLVETRVGRSYKYLKSSVEWVSNEFLPKHKTASIFGSGLRSFDRFKSHYIGHCGLKEITIGNRCFYTRTSIEKIIGNVVVKGKDLGI